MNCMKLFYFILIGLCIACHFPCVELYAQSSQAATHNTSTMTITATKTDKEILSELNAQFIKNFITGDAEAHDKIIHKDFVCIENNGAIVNREDYLKAWATDYSKSHLTSFSYTNEYIRIFGNTALARSKTIATKEVAGETVISNTIYTDTYVKENGRWLCVQAQITPVAKQM